jgi:hypothetical protein
MSFAGTVACFASGYFSLPVSELGQLGVTGVRIVFELVFVTILASLAANVLIVNIFGAGRRRCVLGGG